MAPFFGASTIVWANTIAIVLVALSIGYWFGGRMADRRPTLPALCATVLAASVLMALVPFVSHPFLTLSVEAFDQYSVGAFAGSLFGVLVLVAVPVLMLGSVSPWAIRLKMHSVEDSGEVAGRMYAISTVGSLLGTFAAALLLIPLVGTQRTFLTFALITAAVAALGLRPRWALVPLAIAALMVVPVGTTKGSGEGRVIDEADTEYQYARVVEFPNGTRHLELNEGIAIHSLYRPGTVLTGGYWDAFLVDPLAVQSRAPAPRRDARHRRGHGRPRLREVLPGHGHRRGRDRRRAVRHRAPLLRPAAAAAVARAHRRRAALPARAPRSASTRSSSTPTASRTSRSTWRPRSSSSSPTTGCGPGGAVLINVGHPESSDKLEKVLSATVGSVFTYVVRDPVKRENTILIASDTPPSRDTLLKAQESAAP